MKAGRELDALVAEHALGCDVDWRTYPEGWLENPSPACACKGERWREHDAGRDDYELLPRYSTDIALAWEAAEKAGTIEEDDGPVEVGRLFDFNGDHIGYGARVWGKKAHGTTPAEALALAALRAVGYEEEE